MKKTYIKQNKERILEFARELKNSWDITDKQFEETYYNNFIKN